MLCGIAGLRLPFNMIYGIAQEVQEKNPYVLEGIILSQFLSIKASFLYSSAVLTVED